MSLKQKIEQMFEKYGMTELHFKLPMLANLYDDVVGLLDEATNQIQEKLEEAKEDAKRWKNDSVKMDFSTFETLEDTIQFFVHQIEGTWLVYTSANGRAKALEEVLAVLEGDLKNEV